MVKINEGSDSYVCLSSLLPQILNPRTDEATLENVTASRFQHGKDKLIVSIDMIVYL
jgi:hypothetical protein